MIYPWQERQFLQLISKRGNFPQSLLIHGPAGIGKLEFAHNLIQALLCEHHHGVEPGCGSCRSCQWLKDHQHPDLMVLGLDNLVSVDEEDNNKSSVDKTKEKKKTQIPVDAVRSLTDFLTVGAQRLGHKVVLIEQADALNTNAANALLKVLEEPPKDFLFILVTNEIHKILPTILSRCQRFTMTVPSAEESFQYLDLPEAKVDLLLRIYGTPLQVKRALEMNLDELRIEYLQALSKLDSSLFELTDLALKIPLDYWFDWTHKWAMDLIALHYSNTPWYHHDSPIKKVPSTSELLFDLLAWEKQLLKAKKYSQYPLASRLFVESLLIPWIQLKPKLLHS